MGVVLASMLGQIGLPGGGFAHGLSSMGNNGATPMAVAIPSLPQGRNRVSSFIPVARFSDMLLNRGQTFTYDGEVFSYPDIHLTYWSGGNPFHHQQDLNKLRKAFNTVDTIVVHEPYWTSAARHADIVLPATTTLEREDISAGRLDSRLIAMHKILEPYGNSKDDYWIFSELATRLGVGADFTAGRTPSEWIRVLYDEFSSHVSDSGNEPIPFDVFWEQGWAEIPKKTGPDTGIPFAGFRRAPLKDPLGTPSGKIEIFSQTIASFGYADCLGHPAWLDSPERVNNVERQDGFLQLIANNPANRLHSQLDVGATSQASKVTSREPVRINPIDASSRDIDAGDIVLVFNERGACLAGAVLSEDIAGGTIQLATGAWYEPRQVDGRDVCIHGNPNVLTADVGTSQLSQATSGQLAKVRLEKFTGVAPAVTVTQRGPEISPQATRTI